MRTQGFVEIPYLDLLLEILADCSVETSTTTTAKRVSTLIALLSLILAALVTALMIRPLAHGADRFGLMDYPDGERRVNERAVPRVGGIAIVGGTLASIAAFSPLDPMIISYLCAVGVLLVFGVWDDRVGLPAGSKFVGQVLAAAIVVFGGDVVISVAPFWGLEPLHPLVGTVLTFVTLLAITNAVNLSDGLDGLAGGMMLLSFALIGLLSYEAGGGVLLLLSCIACGATLGFLRYNSYPAWIFMGDTGSQFLGFSAGVFTIVLTQDVNPALSAALPLLILGLPVFDTIMVMAHRWRNKRPLFVADNNHIHHRLLLLGFLHYEAVLTIYVAQALLVTTAFALRYEPDWVVAGAYAGFFVGAVALLRFLSHKKWTRGREGFLTSALERIATLRERRIHVRWPNYLMTVAVVSLFLTSAHCFDVAPDTGIAAGVLAVGIAIFALLRHEPVSGIERGCLFAAAAFFAFQITSSYQTPMVDRTINVLVFLIVALFILSIRYGARHSVFRVSPLDFLVAFLVITVAILSKLQIVEPSLGGTIAFMIIPCYAIEYGAGERVGANMMRIGATIALALVAFKSVVVS